LYQGIEKGDRLKSILQCIVFAAAIGSASAQVTIVQVTSGTGIAGAYFGESFTTPAGGAWNHITFNFYATAASGSTPASTPAAAGTAFLLTQEYLGTPAALSSSTPGFLAQSISNAGGVYTFPPSVVLNPNTQYWVYENALMIATGNGSAGTPAQFAYFSSTATSNFVTFGGTQVANFLVAGNGGVAATPLPSSLLLTVLGVGCLALFQARRKGFRLAR